MRVSYTDTRPMRPRDAEFGITIDFQRGSSNPVNVFQAMTGFLSAIRDLDGLLLGALHPAFGAEMILEDVEAASITTWVRNKLEAVDDGALKEFDWKQQVGKYAVAAKYRILKYLDQKAEAEEAARLLQLHDDLYKLAEREMIAGIPMPDRIPLDKLVKPMDQIQASKQLLGREDKVTFKSEDNAYTVDLSETKRPSDYIDDVEASETNGVLELTLLIRKPDYLGDAQWEFRHGNGAFPAHVEDRSWLERFRAGLEDVRPGSAIACSVRYAYTYDKAGRLRTTKHDDIKVHRTIPPDADYQADWVGERT